MYAYLKQVATNFSEMGLEGEGEGEGEGKKREGREGGR